MKIILPSHKITAMPDADFMMEQIEDAARLCYKSEGKKCNGSAEKIIKSLIKSRHMTPVEMADITVKFICDRGVSHEAVRHRLTSINQESTRYTNYSKDKFGNEITVILPFWCDIDVGSYVNGALPNRPLSSDANIWFQSMFNAEKAYLDLLQRGWKPEQARSVLPNSLKTEFIMKTNCREWMHILNLRCSKKAHPQIRELMLPLLDDLNDDLPVLFGDIYEKYKGDMPK